MPDTAFFDGISGIEQQVDEDLFQPVWIDIYFREIRALLGCNGMFQDSSSMQIFSLFCGSPDSLGMQSSPLG